MSYDYRDTWPGGPEAATCDPETSIAHGRHIQAGNLESLTDSWRENYGACLDRERAHLEQIAALSDAVHQLVDSVAWLRWMNQNQCGLCLRPKIGDHSEVCAIGKAIRAAETLGIYPTGDERWKSER